MSDSLAEFGRGFIIIVYLVLAAIAKLNGHNILSGLFVFFFMAFLIIPPKYFHPS